MAEQTCPDVFFFSNPRTLSNLLSKLLSTQKEWHYGRYFFHDAYLFARSSFIDTPLADISAEKRKHYDDLLRQGFNEFEAARAAAKSEGKPILVKNHTFQIWEPSKYNQEIYGGKLADEFITGPQGISKSNPTMLSDETLLSFIPIFQVRHPALVAESWYRAETRIGEVDLSLKFREHIIDFGYSRRLYDWYITACAEKSNKSKNNGPYEPIIVDCDDILDGSTTINKLCKLCNLDPEQIEYQWDKREMTDDESTNAIFKSYVCGLWNSTSIDKSKSGKNLDLEEKRQQWEVEFGKHVADWLYQFVENSMEDYVYLKDRKI